MNGLKIIKLCRTVNNEQNGKNTDSNFNSSSFRYCFKIYNVGDFMEKTTQHGGARAGAGRKKGSTTNNTEYKNGRIVISCLE